MEKENDYFKKIDDYLLGHLTEKEAADFRQQLEVNAELAAALASQERIRKGMLEGGRRALKAELKMIHREVTAPQNAEAKIKKLHWRPLAAAAAIALLGILTWWLWAPPPQNPQQLFADNYESYQLLLNQRDAADDTLTLEIAQLYRSGKFEEVLPALQAQGQQDQPNAQLLLALAITEYETGHPQNAFAPLNQIIRSNDPFLSDLAHWYSALFHLHLQEVAKARPHLEVLANAPDADKHLEAQKILDHLAKFKK